MIEFKNISKTFETDDGPVRAVQNVNLKINDGEVFGIVGFSGAGKSTLVRMLNGLETPTSGEVIINGKKINGLKGAELREQRKKSARFFNISICCGREPFCKTSNFRWNLRASIKNARKEG